MSSIGGESFISKEGPSILLPLTVVENITRPRVDGHAWRDMAKKSAPVTWMTDVDSDDPNVSQTVYQNMQGTLVSVIDDDGRVTNNVMVISVQILEKKRLLNSVGGITAGLWMLRVQWVLQGS